MASNKKPYTLLPLSSSYLAGRREAIELALHAVEDAKERLFKALDLIDGDPDLEPEGDCEDDDPAEDDDPGGGNVTDEPHDAWTEDGV